jgi:PPM family protein phosphatase
MHTLTVSIYSATDKGLKRRGNEDAHAYCADIAQNPLQWYSSSQTRTVSEGGAFLVVADGMGGASAGEVASSLAVETIREYISAHIRDINNTNIRELLISALLKAHEALIMHQHEYRNTIGMGTTLVITWVFENYVAVAWVGDSRAYKYNSNTGLVALTKDHSMVQKLVDLGGLSKEEAFGHPNQNIITQFVGDKLHTPHPDFNEHMIGSDDILLLCSDGLTGLVKEEDICNILKQQADLTSCGNQLIEEAKKAGGDDNITLILCSMHQS